MTNLVGPVLIFLGLTAFAYAIYLFGFAKRDKRDKRSTRQKNLDSIAEIRGDKRPSNPAKKKAGKSKSH